MKRLYIIEICFIIYLIIIKACSNSGHESVTNDPYNGLPVIETELLFDITDLDETGNGQFYFQSQYFRDMVISNEGNFFVSNAQGNSIQHFDKNGNFIANIGSEGSGPGEFQFSPVFDVLYQDTLFALNQLSWMVNVFVHSNGKWVHNSSFNLEQRNEIRPKKIYQLSDNHLAIEYEPHARRLMMADDNTQFKRVFDKLSPGGEKILDSLLLVPINQLSVYRSKNGGGIMQELPFGVKSVVDTGPANRLYHLETDNFLIKIYNERGQLCDSISHANFSIAIDEDERRVAVEEAATATTGSGNEDQRMKEQMFEMMPAILNPVEGIFVDRDTGHIIVKRSGKYGGPNWLLLNPEGSRAGIFSLDETLEVFDFRKGKIIGALMNKGEEAFPAIRVVSLPEAVLNQ